MNQTQGDPGSIKAKIQQIPWTEVADKMATAAEEHTKEVEARMASEIGAINHLGSTYHVNRTHKHT
jgi:hypothetical protein